MRGQGQDFLLPLFSMLQRSRTSAIARFQGSPYSVGTSGEAAKSTRERRMEIFTNTCAGNVTFRAPHIELIASFHRNRQESHRCPGIQIAREANDLTFIVDVIGELKL